MRSRWALGALVIWTVAAPARADERAEARLEMLRSAGTEHCPTDASLRDAVSARLGYEPWSASAARIVRVHLVVTRRAGLQARIELDEGDGGGGERVLDSANRDCQDLAEALVLALAIAIDPLALTRPAPPAALPPIVADPPPIVAPAPRILAALPATPSTVSATVSPRPAPRRGGARLLGPGLGLSVVSGTAPGASFAVDVTVGIRIPAASIELEARATMPRTTEHDDGSLSVSVLSIGLVPCARFVRVSVCGIASAGAMRASAEDLPGAREGGSPWGAIGARLAWELGLGSVLALRLHGDALAAMTRTSLLVDDEVAWRSPGFSLAAGASILGVP